MTFDEILEELPNLSLSQRRVLVARIVELEPADAGPVTWDLTEEAMLECDQEEKSR
jgi:hypothetical protein